MVICQAIKEHCRLLERSVFQPHGGNHQQDDENSRQLIQELGREPTAEEISDNER